LKFEDHISCIENLEFGKSHNVVGILVALKSKEIRLYNERTLVYTLKCDDYITGMRFFEN
jgi:hypothetical protein